MVSKRANGLLVVFLVVILSASSVRCDDSSEEKKESGEDSSSFRDILRNVGTSIQEGAKKVGETFQKGYEYVKKKVKEIGDDDDDDKIKDIKEAVVKPELVEEMMREGVASLASEKSGSSSVDVDDRFLFDSPPKCPSGQALDHKNRCRPT